MKLSNNPFRNLNKKQFNEIKQQVKPAIDFQSKLIIIVNILSLIVSCVSFLKILFLHINSATIATLLISIILSLVTFHRMIVVVSTNMLNNKKQHQKNKETK